MKRKGWFIPIIVFFICTWLLIVYEQITTEPYLAQTSDLAQLPWDKESAEIQKVIFSAQSLAITATRNENDWFITEPMQAMADSTYIYNVISRFVSPGVIHTIATEVEDPSAFGIYEYSPSIALYDLNNIEYKLIAGDAADEATYYTYSPLTDCIYTIKKEIFDSISTDLSLWRSKDYLNFSPDTTSKIALSKQGTLHTLVSPAGIDTFTSNTLSMEQVNSIISFLSTSKITDFILDNAPSNIISSYKLDSPDLILTLYHTSGEHSSFSLKKAEDGLSYYVLDKSNSNIYKVPFFHFNI